MASLTREDILSVLGPSDDRVITEIIATQATLEELGQAWAWVNNDEAPMNEGKPLPSGRVGELLEILAAQVEEEEEERGL